jgi:hypothetical protein
MAMKELTLGKSIKITTFDSPPQGFNPMTETSARLLQAGLPPRPEDPHHLERYQRVFAQLKGKFNYIQPTFRLREEKTHGARKRRTTDPAQTSGNWSGGVVFAPAGQSFKWIEGDWVVPDVDAPTPDQWYYSASWIGIDGDGSPDVCQAGIECEAYRSGSSITRNIYPWFEWYPDAEVQITNLPISAGDMVTMLICTSQGAGSTTATCYFTNRTNGASTSFGFSAPAGTKLVGNCAEWIVEAPTVDGSQSEVADYGEVFFSVCEAVTTSGTTVNGGTGDNINMTNGSSVVSDGNLITPTVVQCLYAGALP